jgi:hypothetical protein
MRRRDGGVITKEDKKTTTKTPREPATQTSTDEREQAFNAMPHKRTTADYRQQRAMSFVRPETASERQNTLCQHE